MPPQWYWMQDGQEHGPIDTAGLKELARSSQLKPTDLIWQEGLPDWVPVAEAKGLFPDQTLAMSGQPVQNTGLPLPPVPAAPVAAPISPAPTQSDGKQRIPPLWIVGAIIGAVILFKSLGGGGEGTNRSFKSNPPQRHGGGEKGNPLKTEKSQVGQILDSFLSDTAILAIPIKKMDGDTSLTQLDKEAAKQALDHWKPTKLGQSFYVASIVGSGPQNRDTVKTIYELRNVRLELFPKQLSEADKLNGAEWTGDIGLKADAGRNYCSQSRHDPSSIFGTETLPPDTTWSRWGGNFSLVATYHKDNGTWTTDELTLFTFKQVEASDLPTPLPATPAGSRGDRPPEGRERSPKIAETQPASDFLGEWTNRDFQTLGITRIRISRAIRGSGRIVVRIWTKSSGPTGEWDHGDANAVLGNKILSVNQTSLGDVDKMEMTLLENGDMQVDAHPRFSGRESVDHLSGKSVFGKGLIHD